MDLQSESDPQPSGKINKTAFKLFGKRKPGSPVSSFFSIKSKGEGCKGAAKAPLVRSNTHDGIMETQAEQEGRREELRGANEPSTAAEPIPAVSPRTSFSSITSLKSLSFFTLLRRGSRAGEGGRSSLTEPRHGARRRRGLKGLFSSVRWHRKEQGIRDEQEEPPPPALLLASRSNSVEIVKEHMTLTPRPPSRAMDAPTPPTSEPDEDAPISTTIDDGSPLMEMAGDQWNKIFYPYSALTPKDMSALTMPAMADSGDKESNTSNKTGASSEEQEQNIIPDTIKVLNEDELKAKNEMVAEEIASPTPASIAMFTAASASKLTSASVHSSNASASYSHSSGSGQALPPASIPETMPSLASVPKSTLPISSPISTTAPAALSINMPAHATTSFPAHTSSPALSPDQRPTPAPAHVVSSASILTPTPPSAQRPCLPQTPAPSPACIPTPTPVVTQRPSQTQAQTPIPASPPTSSTVSISHTSLPSHMSTPAPVLTPSTIPTPVMSPVSSLMSSPGTSPSLTPISSHVPVLDTTHSPGFKPTTAASKTVVSMDTVEGISSQDTVPVKAMTSGVEDCEKVLGRVVTCAEKGKELNRENGAEDGATGQAGTAKKLFIQDEDIKAQSLDFQHVVLQGEAGSPASSPPSELGHFRAEKRPPPVKALGLSKIPVSGCTRGGKQPREALLDDRRSKDPQDFPPNYDEGYWDSPTPGMEEESARSLTLESEESPGAAAAAGEKTTPGSTVEPKLTPSAMGSGRSQKINSSLPRDSKIPIKQSTSHAGNHGMPTTSTPSTHVTKTEAPRTKIPMSKVPVRRTSARPAPVNDQTRK